MDLLWMCCAACLASLLTFFSGFGLGTLLLPVLSLFYGPASGVVLTAFVHFLNGLYKAVLLRKHMQTNVALKFALFAIPSAIAGSWCLFYLSDFAEEPFFTASIGRAQFFVDPLGVVIGALMLCFGLMELLPTFQTLSFSPRLLWLGGLSSGFFGGLSGHQGALRSAFLIRLQLTKEQYLATGVLIAIFIDLTRLPYYLFYNSDVPVSALEMGPVLLSALFGTWLGNRYLKKVSIRWVRNAVAAFLLLSGLAFLTGFHFA